MGPFGSKRAMHSLNNFMIGPRALTIDIVRSLELPDELTNTTEHPQLVLTHDDPSIFIPEKEVLSDYKFEYGTISSKTNGTQWQKACFRNKEGKFCLFSATNQIDTDQEKVKGHLKKSHREGWRTCCTGMIAHPVFWKQLKKISN